MVSSSISALTTAIALTCHFLILCLLQNQPLTCQAFTVSSHVVRDATVSNSRLAFVGTAPVATKTSLYMSDGGGGGGTERSKSTKKGLTTITIDKTETKSDQEQKKEEQWRVVLHNDEVHTFNYVIQSLCKVIGTLDRKRAFDICVLTHGSGKATITQTWKQQAMKYCLGLQRQGLTASIAPESRFSGDSGGEPDAGKD